ncbi:hypothetical protein HYR69_11010, partial [Candidatus Sumerlaeota bacterium]|nr:hypothetical protein [Candidatus Sumerlaeota bacterium]
MTLDSNASPTMILAADRKSPLNVFDEHAARIGAKVVYGNASRPEELDQLAENADAVIVFRTPVSASA